jgi:hypothetical protein
MLQRLLTGAALALCVVACASTPSVPGADAPKTAASGKLPPAGCVGTTATRLPVEPRECAGFGRAYTSEDVKRTGYTEVNQALSTLDPDVTTASH